MSDHEANLSRRVLIVEDEANQRQMLTRAIREAEFEPHAVASAEAALALLEDDDRFCIAILDLRLTGIDGLELARRIHDRWPAMRCIILTGYATLDAARQAIKLDVVDFLIKPVTLGELESALARAWLKHCDRAPRPRPNPPSAAPPAPSPVASGGAVRIADAERKLIEAALARSNNNRVAAAAELGISLRTLYYRLARYEAEDEFRESRTS